MPEPARPLVVVIAAATLAIGVTYATTAIGGADSYGYVSQADLLLQGRMTMEQPWVTKVPWPAGNWTFTPLGWNASASEPTLLTPVYPPGLSWLMALAKLVGGQEGLFWVVPV